MEKITISRELLERVEDDVVVSRIPGMKRTYLYLSKKDILEMGEYTILANIRNDGLYTVGGQLPEQTARVMSGNELLKNYHYREQFDPQLQKTSKYKPPKEHMTQRKSVTQEVQKVSNSPEKKVGKQQESNSMQPVKQVQQYSTSNKPSTREQSDSQLHNSSEKSLEEQQELNNMQPAKQVQQYLTSNHPFTKEQFRQIRLGEKHRVDVTKYWDIRLSAEQMRQLRLMLEDGVDIQRLGYTSPEMAVEKLEELRLTHKIGYAPNYNWKLMNAGQMREIRLGMEKGVKTTEYSWPAYNAEQMKQLRLGMQQGFDISGYKNPHFTAKQMYNLRCLQIWERIKSQIQALWQAFKETVLLNNLNRINQHIREQIYSVLDKSIQYMENPKTVKGMAPVDVPTETVDNRIQETIQDIKELLVSQELADEAILSDEKMSQKMDERIRNALDELMSPENVQNPENQEAVIKKAADNLMQDTGAEKVMEEQKEALTESSKQDITQNISDMRSIYQTWVDMDIEDFGEVSTKTLAELQQKGLSLAKENGVYKVVAPEPEVSQEIQQQAMELMEQAEQRQVANNIKLCK